MSLSGARPEPVLNAAKVAGAVSGLVVAAGAVTTLVGWTTAEQIDSAAVLVGGLVTALAALVAVVAPLVAAYRARPKVTPLADPRDANGTPLVPATGGHVVTPQVAGVADHAAAEQ